MGTSPYFQQVVFGESIAADQVFEGGFGDLFESSPNKSYVDVHMVLHTTDEGKVRADSEVIDGQEPDRFDLDDGFSDTTCGTTESFELPSRLDECKYASPRPSHCSVEPDVEPDVYHQRVTDSVDLEESLRNVESRRSWRVCFLRQRNSYSRLSISRELYAALISCLGVFPKFNDFIILFGIKQEETEMALPPLIFRAQVPIERGLKLGWALDYECAYGLRYVELNHRSMEKPWSIRQMAVYQSYKNVENSSTWIIVSASPKTETCVDRYIESVRNLQDLDPFELHVLILMNAVTNWRPYIVHMTQRISQSTDEFSVASIDKGHPTDSLNFEARQILNDLEHELIDVLSVLDSTEETVDALQEHHEQYGLIFDQTTDRRDQSRNTPVRKALQEMMKQISTNRKEVYALRSKLKGTIKLLSSLLDLENGISLKRLTQEAAEESGEMRRLTEKSTRDAATMKVLTIITIIYLPATAISNFFSTEFVSLNGANNVVEFSTNAWLFIVLALPLTLITLIIWWVWVRSWNRAIDKGVKNRISPLTRIATHRRSFQSTGGEND